MSVYDVVCTWIGRVWSGMFLLLVLSLAAGRIYGLILDRRERRAQYRRDVATVHELAEQIARTGE